MTVTLDALVADLRTVRAQGLPAARRIRLPALEEAAATLAAADGGPPSTAEDLLRQAVEKLDPGQLATAAGYTFGLVPGTRDWVASDRRKKCADIYRVGVDRIRKHHERIVMDEVAGIILARCRAASFDGGRPAAPEAPRDAPREALRDGPAGGRLTSTRTFSVRFGSRTAPVSVHHRSIELMTGVDILVSPENVYLAVATMFKSSASAAIRRRAARRGPAGEVTDDVVPRELAARPLAGLAVQPGTVVATSGGELRDQGVRRVYHAAIASPRVGTNEYDTDPAAVGLAVTNVFRLAREENRTGTPPLTSIALPLLGAGRGGLDPMTSLTWIWGSLEDELARDGPWHVHFVARNAEIADAIAARLAAAADPDAPAQ